jgi:hypothetical protein
MVITKMLLPSDNEIKQEPLTASLKFKSERLENKFKLYVSSKFLYLSKIILLLSSSSMLLYVALFHILGSESSKGRLAINLLILFFLPLLYLSTFWFNWSRRVSTYSRLFQVFLLFGSSIYSITTNSEYSLLGVLVLLFLALQFDTSFLGFAVLSIMSLSLFGVS